MTESEVDDLVEQWHSTTTHPEPLSKFIRSKTGWTAEEYERWVVTGEMP